MYFVGSSHPRTQINHENIILMNDTLKEVKLQVHAVLSMLMLDIVQNCMGREGKRPRLSGNLPK